MAVGDIETRKVNGRWVNIVMGTHNTQDEAAAAGRRLARQLGVEWYLRSSRGFWRARNSYGRDPRRTKN